jgi:uncharacterized HAD superfamily protein
MDKKWIVFDVDDVICNFRESLYQSFKDIGKDIHWNDWTSYRHNEIYSLSGEEELRYHMAHYEVMQKSHLEEHVCEIFNRLKQKGYSIGLLTARGWHEEGLKITEQFVEKYNLPVDKVVISGMHMDKKSAHKDKFDGELVAYIDDSIHHIEDFTSQHICAFLLDRPWNRLNNTLPRVHSLLEFEQKINELNNKNNIILKMK